MRILFVTNGFPPAAFAGVELHTYQLCQALAGRQHVGVFCRTADLRRPEFSLQHDEYEGLPVWRVTNNFLDVVSYAGYYLSPEVEAHFVHVLKEWQPQLIHFQHCLGLSARLPEIGHAHGIPSILTLHDYWYLCPTVQLRTASGALCPGTHHAPNCFECVRFANPALAWLHRTRLYRRARRHLPDLIKRAAAAAVRSLQELSQPTANESATPRPPTSAQVKAIAARVEVMRRALSFPLRITAPSAFVKEVYVEFGLAPERIEVIPLGMDLSLWRRSPRRKTNSSAGLRFAYLGGLLPHKGVEVVIRAFQSIVGDGHELRLHGFDSVDVRFNQHLDALIQADGRIRKFGPYAHADAPRLLREADVLLIPSLWHETFSFVAREAFLAGVWVLASDVGAIREVVLPGRTGQRVPPGDVAAWAAAMQTTIESWPPPEHPAEPPFPVLTHAQYAARLEALYESLLGQR
jgi:glycosyltransferase involved in cell wall biosynthesis